MNDAVSVALYGRGREQDGLSRMVAISGGVHVAIVAAMLLVPAAWFHRPSADPQNVMTISLGGAPGPKTGGMTPIGGRAIQKAVDSLPKAEPVRPPAQKTPEMVEPIKSKPALKNTPTPVKDAPKEARSRTPTTGAETREGRAMAETGSQSNTLGLTTGGGGTGGQINLGNFCCPDYILEMNRLIMNNWNSRQNAQATSIVQFTIHRDGTVSDIKIFTSSGYAMLDMFAQRALQMAKLPPLPPAYTNETLTVNLSFEYHR
jgi:protein TonB